MEKSVCCELNYSSLAKHIGVSVDTIKKWINTLSQFYFCFTISPWTNNIPRSLIKQQKIYLWDLSVINTQENTGIKYENFIASHLHKAVNYWTDTGLADVGLAYVRDKEKREVDFLVYKNNKPWFLVEVKASSKAGLSKSLQYYHKILKTEHAFQVAFDLPYADVDCFSYSNPCIVPASTFLSQFI